MIAPRPPLRSNTEKNFPCSCPASAESYVAAAADECEFASHSLRLVALRASSPLLPSYASPPPSPPPHSLRISCPQQSAASRGEIKRNVRFDGGGGVDVQRNGAEEGREDTIRNVRNAAASHAMPSIPYGSIYAPPPPRLIYRLAPESRQGEISHYRP